MTRDPANGRAKSDPVVLSTATAVLLDDDYVSVRWWEGENVALVSRTAKPLPDDERGLDRHFSTVLAALSGLRRPKTALVVDGRR